MFLQNELNVLKDPAGRALICRLYVNSFVMVVYEKFYVKFSQNFLSKQRLKKISHRQPLQYYSRISQKWVLFLQGV